MERGWHVAVYCQDDVAAVTQRCAARPGGVELIHVQTGAQGPRGTLEFDWHCIRDAARRKESVSLVLGYNSGAFIPISGSPAAPSSPIWTDRVAAAEMVGSVKAWFWINEWIAAWASHRLVADHPIIADHLATPAPVRQPS